MGSISLQPPSQKIRNAATFLRRPRLLCPVWLRQKRNSKRNGITNETWRIVVGVFRLVDFLSATHNPLKGIGYLEMLRRGGKIGGGGYAYENEPTGKSSVLCHQKKI